MIRFRRALNRIQSRIYPTAFNSNENILVSAPTGAGKTNIAMISVLREVGRNMTGGMIDKNAFKIVYVAPMKALAAEVTSAFSHRLAPLGTPICRLAIPLHSNTFTFLMLYFARSRRNGGYSVSTRKYHTQMSSVLDHSACYRTFTTPA